MRHLAKTLVTISASIALISGCSTGATDTGESDLATHQDTTAQSASAQSGQVPRDIISAYRNWSILRQPLRRTRVNAGAVEVALGIIPVDVVAQSNKDHASRFDVGALVACTVFEVLRGDLGSGWDATVF